MMTDNTYPLDSGKILLIHASAVQTDNGALIFLGPSETGKSTICRLLSARTQPLADDAVYLIPQKKKGWAVTDASRRAFAGRLSAKETTALHSVPLRAIFRLYQAQTLVLERIDELQTCRYLTDAFLEIRRQRNYDIETKKSALSFLAAIARWVPGYRLCFSLSPGVSEVIDCKIDRQ